VAAWVTPLPRVTGTRETFGGIEMRVTWWRPGWGERHPGIMLVNGATALGNDDPETVRLADALARAGYLVMLPEFPFIQEGTLEPRAPEVIDSAFGRALALSDTAGMPVSAFGFSVGGGLLLAAASRPGPLEKAAYVGVLGAYFDLNTYLASVLAGAQMRDGQLVAWDPDPIVSLRLPLAAAETLTDSADRARVIEALHEGGGHLTGEPPNGLGSEAVSLWNALAASQYDLALGRLRSLPPTLRDVFERLSPRTAWSQLRTPVFWLHDVGDRFEPVAEAEVAASTPHPAATRFHRTELLSHAAALGSGAREKGIDFWAAELSGLLVFATEALAAGS
jgi:dienelactone hydrolase